jgi:CPA2 family monovalent cation:H+ antiporter-2
MPPHSALIITVAASIGIAFLFGLAAARLRLPPIVGYLLAGIAVGPFTPGNVVDSGMIAQAAELGVILLMFGVGLHFSLGDLAAVRRIVIPGAILNSVTIGTIGTVIARSWGQTWGGALVIGISVSVASTVVLLKALEAQDRLDSPEGRIAVGWLVVEDLQMVFVLVLLPAVAPMLGGAGGASAALDGALMTALGIAVVKVAAFAALMVLVGRRVVPWMLAHVAKLGSRELFTLAVLTTALGIATLASEVFGVSFALGAFFAGAVVSESELSHRAATEALPMQDAFAVLFFLSVGILFDPTVLVDAPMAVAALVALIVIGKFATSFALMRLLGQPARSALVIGGSLAQIGEFSFIVAGLGVSLGLITGDAQALVVASALIAITLNQPLLRAVRYAIGRSAARDEAITAPRTVPESARSTRGAMRPDDDPFDFSALSDHVVVVGHGRVGTTVTEALQRDAARYVVVEEQERLVAGMRARGERSVFGDATRAEVLQRAGVAHAALIVVTAPEPIRARRTVELARELNPQIAVAVRTHSATEQTFFEELLHVPGARGRAIYAEREAAFSLAQYTLQTLGRSDDEADLIIDSMRNVQTRPTETFQALPTREFRAMMAPDPNHASKPES